MTLTKEAGPKRAMAAVMRAVSISIRRSAFIRGFHQGHSRGRLQPVTSLQGPWFQIVSQPNAERPNASQYFLLQRKISTRGEHSLASITRTTLGSFEADLHVDDHGVTSGRSRRPLVLLIPFLGASPDLMYKYGAVYGQLGADVLYICTINMASVILPDVVLPRTARRLFHLLQKEDGPFAGRRFMIHSMSGGYVFVGCLMEKLGSTGARSGVDDDIGDPTSPNGDVVAADDLRRRLVGVVYDSPMIEGASIGPGVMLWLRNPAAQWALTTYYELIPAVPASYDRLCQSAARLDPSPKLMLHSRRDHYSRTASVQSLVDSWQARGVPVKVTMWDDAQHVGLLATQPERYKQELGDFMRQFWLND